MSKTWPKAACGGRSLGWKLSEDAIIETSIEVGRGPAFAGIGIGILLKKRFRLLFITCYRVAWA